MATILLFKDVSAVQICLEELKILNYDANRIYELLEANQDNAERVHFVVESIRNKISSDFSISDYDILSPEVMEVLDVSDDDNTAPEILSGQEQSLDLKAPTSESGNDNVAKEKEPPSESTDSPEPSAMPKLFFSPLSNKVPFSKFFGESASSVEMQLENIYDEFKEYVPQKKKFATATCTSVRPEQLEEKMPVEENQGLPCTETRIPLQRSTIFSEQRTTSFVTIHLDAPSTSALQPHEIPTDSLAQPATKVSEAIHKPPLPATVTGNTLQSSVRGAATGDSLAEPATKVSEAKHEPRLPATVTGNTLQSSVRGAATGYARVIGPGNEVVFNPMPNSDAGNNTADRAPATFKIPPTFAAAMTATAHDLFIVPKEPAVLDSTNVAASIDPPILVNGEKSIEVLAAPEVQEVPIKLTGAIKKKVRKDAPPHKFLKQLREVFPDVDVAFLERQCAKQADDSSLETLVEKLLNQQDLPLKPKVEINSDFIDVIPKNKEEDQKAAFQAFLEILPDADPEYLESQYKSFNNDPEKLKRFVADALERKDYPTLESYKKRQAQFALEKQFKDNFDLLKFLELFPDPFTHFQNVQHPAPLGPLPAGRAFLMARYRTVRCVTIDRVYRRNRWMLYPTCKELDESRDSIRPRPNHEIIAIYKGENNLGFLQEIAFIENEQNIIDHLKAIEDAKTNASNERAAAFAEAKDKGELLTCGCCFDDEVLNMDMVTCEEGHLFCKECVKKGAEVQIGQGKTDFPCLEDCGANIRLETLETVLLPSVFSRLVQRKQIEEVKAAGIDCFESCPFCDFGMIPHPEDRIFDCQNPSCRKQSCRLCKEVSHIPLRCDEVEKSEEVKARTYIEDQMTQALIRECWKCGKKFVKSDGCNKMTCSCGALMCYVCRKPVTDYSHFNGQGGDAFEKCPLYSHNNQLHVDAVAEVARKAKEEMAAKNPTLAFKHDPTLILPEKVAERNPPNAPGWLPNIAPPEWLPPLLRRAGLVLPDEHHRQVNANIFQAVPARAHVEIIHGQAWPANVGQAPPPAHVRQAHAAAHVGQVAPPAHVRQAHAAARVGQAAPPANVRQADAAAHVRQAHAAARVGQAAPPANVRQADAAAHVRQAHAAAHVGQAAPPANVRQADAPAHVRQAHAAAHVGQAALPAHVRQAHAAARVGQAAPPANVRQADAAAHVRQAHAAAHVGQAAPPANVRQADAPAHVRQAHAAAHVGQAALPAHVRQAHAAARVGQAAPPANLRQADAAAHVRQAHAAAHVGQAAPPAHVRQAHAAARVGQANAAARVGQVTPPALGGQAVPPAPVRRANGVARMRHAVAAAHMGHPNANAAQVRLAGAAEANLAVLEAARALARARQEDTLERYIRR